MSRSSSCLYYLHYRSTSEKNRYDSDVLNDYDSDVLNDFSLPYYALHYRWLLESDMIIVDCNGVNIDEIIGI